MLPVSSGQSAVIVQRRQVSQYKVTAICLSADLLGKQSVQSSKTRQLIFHFRLGKNRVTLETEWTQITKNVGRSLSVLVAKGSGPKIGRTTWRPKPRVSLHPLPPHPPPPPSTRVV